MTDAAERIERLTEIKDQMKELLGEAEQLLRDTNEEDSARAYWMAHIRCSLDDDHMYLGGSMVTMQTTIDALIEEVEPETCSTRPEFMGDGGWGH